MTKSELNPNDPPSPSFGVAGNARIGRPRFQRAAIAIYAARVGQPRDVACAVSYLSFVRHSSFVIRH